MSDAAERGTPLVGICRESQLINVAFGDDLIQQPPTTHAHREPVLGSRRFAEHGMVEAAIHETAPVVGVQWHSELEASRPGQRSRLLRPHRVPDLLSQCPTSRSRNSLAPVSESSRS